ncbi:PAS domain S-box protein [Pelotomaculum isophthalicicum JI]|uniref:histidine kinase n=1 Tax=Pelotomaculum isophthalicicum JI TaxID=947010 RepID=A0A9X4H2Y7_9FIRM|nr:PAS domain S-box protein [Pelotomaculum isophthalicicum]MDF9409255.1 PAS domain S-box protein [Pelotomaculum isophthalicicum JI]
MDDTIKTQEQLINELVELRKQLSESRKLINGLETELNKEKQLNNHQQFLDVVEEEVIEYRNHLEELVKQRTIELTTTNERLQQEIIERKQVEEALRESEERYRQLVELSPDAIIIHTEGIISFSNKVGAELVGAKSTNELIGKSVMDFIHPDYRETAQERWRQIKDKGVTLPFSEGKLINSNGDDVHIESAITPISFHGGKLSVQIVTRDITERKRAEKALKESHNRFVTVLDSLDAGVYVADMETYEILFTNEYTREYLGAAEGEICWQSIQTGQSGPCDFCNNKSLTNECESTGIYKWEVQNTRNGKWYECRDRVIRWIDGRMVKLEIATDITERKQQKELIEAERKRLFTLLDSLPAYVCLIAPDYSIPFANRYFQGRFGKPDGRTCFEIYRNINVPCKGCQTFNVFDTNAPKEWELTSLDGDTYQIYDYPFTDIDGSPLVLELGIDITKRKQAENLFKTLTNSSPVGIYILQNGKFQFVNPRFQKYTDYSDEELIGMYSLELVITDDRKTVRENAIKMLKGKRYGPYVYRILRKDGKTRWIMETVAPIQYYGKPAILANCLDITWHKRTERMLRLSKERFSKAFNAGPNPMAINVLSDGRYIDVNNSFINVFGFSRQEIIGRTTIDLNVYANPEDRAKIVDLVLEHGVIHNLELNFRIKSGEIRMGLLSADTIELSGKQCILVTINDITERKQVEKEMARLERLNLVGEMAAGIGHEIRNPMTTVRGFLQMLSSKKENVNHKYFGLMIEELDRANSIITEYLSIAKNKPVDLKLMNLNQLVQTLFPLIQADAINADKYIEVKLAEIPDLLLDEKEIRQLILNLVRNGLEAMSPGGKLLIKTFIDGDTVILSVQDHGSGIKTEVLEKIGTPFFTTKDTGTGLGLAVCYSIADRHNATIDIETGPSGTTFFIRFGAVIG